MVARRDNRQPSLRPFRVDCFLLCDQAQSENGKLYILGGGWDEVSPHRLPFQIPVAVAIKLVVPAERAVEPVSIRVDLLDVQGEPIGEPFAAGRLTATPNEPVTENEEVMAEASVFLAVSTLMQIVEAGRFTLDLVVNDQVVATTGFTVNPPARDDEVKGSERGVDPMPAETR